MFSDGGISTASSNGFLGFCVGGVLVGVRTAMVYPTGTSFRFLSPQKNRPQGELRAEPASSIRGADEHWFHSIYQHA
ncbi:hypothetical protein DBB29_19645 [Pandoraea cepalis]|uniref:Uncharacterized protein n=1 Tax=Pandoraea cepalis TaxID=2508294 RepID=A0AAW7MPT8_9BURK|nr:hypothetical protein [Pandoraea cepalis]MDN4580321.1 hypothetical protein [Pandoraea cepalis]